VALGEHLSYASFQARHPNEVVAFADVSNMQMFGHFTSLELQRACFSNYYGAMNLKPLVTNYPGSWVAASQLFSGGVTDTRALERSKFVEGFAAAAAADPHPDRPRNTLTTDRGFAVAALCALLGVAFRMPPKRRKKQHALSTQEGLVTVAVARERAENERAVRRLFVFGFLQRKLDLSMRADVVDAVVRSIAFRSNAVYRPLTCS